MSAIITKDSQWREVNSPNWGGRVMSRTIKLEGGDIIVADIYWRAESITIKNEYSVSYPKCTGKHNPCLHVSYWRPGSVGGMFSSGLGEFYTLTGSFSRRTIKPLREMAEKIDAHQILISTIEKTAPNLTVGSKL